MRLHVILFFAIALFFSGCATTRIQTQNMEAARSLALLFKICDTSDSWDSYPATLQDLSKALRTLHIEDTIPQCRCADGVMRDFIYIAGLSGTEGRDTAFLFSPPEMGGDMVIVSSLDATTKVMSREEAKKEMEKSYALIRDRNH
jgi:uncharacterized protein YceK